MIGPKLGTAAPLNAGTSAGQVLTWDAGPKYPAGDGSQLTNLPGGGGADYLPKTANYTAVDKDSILANTNGGAFTVTLPASPTAGNFVIIADALSTWATNNLTVGRNSQLIESTAANLVADVNGVQMTLVFVGGSVGWRVLYQMATASGSGGSPQLPTWTWVAGGGDPGQGQFTTDDSTIAGTTVFKVSQSSAVGGYNLSNYFGYTGYTLIVMDSTGEPAQFLISAYTVTGAGDFLLTGGYSTGGGNWSGAYSFVVTPIAATAIGQLGTGLVKANGAVASIATPGTDYATAAQTLLANILSTAGITPCADGTVTPVTSITTVNGIITAIS